jgi:hypothetical protein
MEPLSASSFHLIQPGIAHPAEDAIDALILQIPGVEEESAGANGLLPGRGSLR